MLQRLSQQPDLIRRKDHVTGTQLTPAHWFGQRPFSVESPAHRAETSHGASISSLPTTQSKGKTCPQNHPAKLQCETVGRLFLTAQYASGRKSPLVLHSLNHGFLTAHSAPSTGLQGCLADSQRILV